MLKYRFFDATQFKGIDVVTLCQSHWLKPEFALSISSIYMDMRRFHALIRIKMEAPSE